MSCCFVQHFVVSSSFSFWLNRKTIGRLRTGVVLLVNHLDFLAQIVLVWRAIYYLLSCFKRRGSEIYYRPAILLLQLQLILWSDVGIVGDLAFDSLIELAIFLEQILHWDLLLVAALVQERCSRHCLKLRHRHLPQMFEAAQHLLLAVLAQSVYH